MTESILATITNDLNSYSRSAQAVAQVILDQPARVLSMSIVELAQLADVSDPTVLRFSRKLGFSGYKDFKRALAEELTPASGENIDLGTHGYLKRIVGNYTRDFTQIMAGVNEDAFTRAVEVLSEATKVEFWGQCTSSTLATDAYDKFFRAGIACVVSTEPNLQRLYSREFGPGDVILAISHLGHNEDIARSLSQASALGATTISIATEGSLVAQSSSISITTKPIEQDMFGEMNMKAAHVFIVDALAIATTIAKGGGNFQTAGE
ncbi:MAG: MurR/RpiR family transcriptional regulator [Atopobiaceae bacterium]|nr:MurR/RpiR family transcriptional regulator [Atopobiaceae bacterium]